MDSDAREETEQGRTLIPSTRRRMIMSIDTPSWILATASTSVACSVPRTTAARMPSHSSEEEGLLAALSWSIFLCLTVQSRKRVPRVSFQKPENSVK